MNGLAILLAPPGGMPEVMGMAGRPPGTAENATDADGFLGILQQMISGSVQMASLLSMMPMQPPQGSEGEGGDAAQAPLSPDPAIVSVAGSSVDTEQPSVPILLSSSPPGPSPPGVPEGDLPQSAPTASAPAVVEHFAAPDLSDQATALPKNPATVEVSLRRSGGMPLPVAVEAAIEEGAPPVEVKAAGKPASSATLRDDTAAVHAPADRPEKPASRVSESAPEVHPKNSVPGRDIVSSWVRAGRQLVVDRPDGQTERSANAPDVRVTQRPEQEPRMLRTPATVAEGTARVEREPVQRTQYAATPERVQMKADAAEEETPVAAETDNAMVRSDEAPAKAVTAAKPVVASVPHDGESAKNAASHQQVQIAAVKPSVARGEFVSARLADIPVALPPETASSVIDQVVKEAALQVNGETSEMRITLVPASLGEVTLNVRMEGGQMQAQIDVTHAAVKAALEVNIGQLREALSSRGIDVQRLDVYQNGQSPAHDTGGNQGDRYRRQSGRRHPYATDAIAEYRTGRLMGYNTMEVVM